MEIHDPGSVVQVRSRGIITLSTELREKSGIDRGDRFRLVDLDGIFVLTPMVPFVPDLAGEIEKSRRETGLGIADLLRGLREQRASCLGQEDAADEG